MGKQSCSKDSQNSSQIVKILKGSERIFFFIYILHIMVYNMQMTGYTCIQMTVHFSEGYTGIYRYRYIPTKI